MSQALPIDRPCQHCASQIERSFDDTSTEAPPLGPLPSITAFEQDNRWIAGAAVRYRRLCSCARSAGRDSGVPKKAAAVSVAVVSTGISLFGGAMPLAADYHTEAFGTGTVSSYPNDPPPSVSNPPKPTTPTKTYPNTPPPSVNTPTPAPAPVEKRDRNPNEATDDAGNPPVVQSTAPKQPPPQPVPVDPPQVSAPRTQSPSPTPTPSPSPAPSSTPTPALPPASGPDPAPTQTPAQTPGTSYPSDPPPSVVTTAPPAAEPNHGYDEIPLPAVELSEPSDRSPSGDRPQGTAESDGRDEAPDDGPASRPMQFAPQKPADDSPKRPAGEDLVDAHQGNHFEPTPGADYVEGIDGFLEMTGEHGRYILETWKNGGGVVGPKGSEEGLLYGWLNDPESNGFELFQEFAYHHDLQATDALAQGGGAAFTVANAGSAVDGMAVLLSTGDLDAALALTSAEFGLFGFTVRERYEPVPPPPVDDVSPEQPPALVIEQPPVAPVQTMPSPVGAAPSPAPPTKAVEPAGPVESSAPITPVEPITPIAPVEPVRATTSDDERVDDQPTAPEVKPLLAERPAAPIARPEMPSHPEPEVDGTTGPAPTEIPGRTEDGQGSEKPEAVEPLEAAVESPEAVEPPEAAVESPDVVAERVSVDLIEVEPEDIGPDEDVEIAAAALPSPVLGAPQATIDLGTGPVTGRLVGEVTVDGDVRLIVQSEDGTQIVAFLVPAPGHDL